MKRAFEGGNAIFQSNISLLQRLMNAISPPPVNLDLYFHKMHKLDKDSESTASYGAEGTYDSDTITSLWKKRLLDGGDLTGNCGLYFP